METKDITTGMLKNVEQPKLAKTLIKLREVYIEYLTETNQIE